MASRDLLFKAVMDVSDLKRGLSGIEREAQQTNSKLSSMGAGIQKAMGAAAALGIGAIGVELFKAGSQAEAFEQRYATVFEGVTASMDEWIDAQNELFGVSEAQMKGMTASVGDLLVPLGFARSQAAELSKEALEIANALSEWTGGTRDAAEVTDIISKALLGEREALKGLGVSITEADVKAQMASGNYEGMADAQAKALATLDLIAQRSADALSAYAEGGNEAMRASKDLAATIADLKEEAGALVVELAPLLGIGADLLGPIAQGIKLQMTPILELQKWVTGEGRQRMVLLRDQTLEEYLATVGQARTIVSEASGAFQDLAAEAGVMVTGAFDRLFGVRGSTGFDRVRDGARESRSELEDLAVSLRRMLVPGLGLTALETRRLELAFRPLETTVEDLGDTFEAEAQSIGDIWRGLPEEFEDASFDIQAALRNALTLRDTREKFVKGMKGLADRGLDALSREIGRNPNRAEAIAALEALQHDFIATMNLEEALGGDMERAFIMLQNVMNSDAARASLQAFHVYGNQAYAEWYKGWSEGNQDNPPKVDPDSGGPWIDSVATAAALDSQRGSDNYGIFG